MGTIKENLDGLIKTIMLEQNKEKLEVLRLIKTAFMNFETSKNAKILDDINEIQIIKKMVSQRLDAIEQYKVGGRKDLVEKEEKEILVLNEFLPEEISKEQIEELLLNFIFIMETPPTIKDMGSLVKRVKEVYPTVDGKLLSDLIRNKLI